VLTLRMSMTPRQLGVATKMACIYRSRRKKVKSGDVSRGVLQCNLFTPRL
jgi:hypothetical protein